MVEVRKRKSVAPVVETQKKGKKEETDSVKKSSAEEQRKRAAEWAQQNLNLTSSGETKKAKTKKVEEVVVAVGRSTRSRKTADEIPKPAITRKTSKSVAPKVEKEEEDDEDEEEEKVEIKPAVRKSGRRSSVVKEAIFSPPKTSDISSREATPKLPGYTSREHTPILANSPVVPTLTPLPTMTLPATSSMQGTPEVSQYNEIAAIVATPSKTLGSHVPFYASKIFKVLLTFAAILSLSSLAYAEPMVGIGSLTIILFAIIIGLIQRLVLFLLWAINAA